MLIVQLFFRIYEFYPYIVLLDFYYLQLVIYQFS